MRISLEEAVRLLTHDQVVAIPTETVYGLAASIAFPHAIARIFTLKGRPSSNPLIIHASSEKQVVALASSLPEGFSELSAAFWPGPMTLVLPVKEEMIASAIRSGLPTAAFRIPNHLLARELLEMTGPLVMPSANLSGKPSATAPEHVEHDFEADFPVLDGGRCGHGLESTILIHLEGVWQIIRLGALPPASFRSVLGYEPIVRKESPLDKPICPGQMFRHYAPKAKLILAKEFVEKCDVIVGFSDRTYPVGSQLITIGSSEDPEHVAENLYSVLRELDERNIACAWVDINFPGTGLWETIIERLRKASQD